MPARAKAASYTRSASAGRPGAARPERTTITGLLRAAARAADMNLRGDSTASMYSRMERVRESLASWSSRSPTSMSACWPSDTTCEKPMPRARAQSSIALTSEPDCDTKASSPAVASLWAMLAFSPMCGDSMPTQAGPSTRSRCGLRRVEHGLALGRVQPGAEHDGRARAAAAEFGHDARHGGRGRAHHCQVGRRGQLVEAHVHTLPIQPPVLGVDCIHRPLERAGAQVAPGRGAHAVRPRRGTHDHHRARVQQRVQVARAQARLRRGPASCRASGASAGRVCGKLTGLMGVGNARRA